MMIGLLAAHCLSSEATTEEKSGVSIGYYSVVKIQHLKSDLFLSSIDLNYQKGSFQQLTRAINSSSLAETLWAVYPLPNQTSVNQGDPIHCGDSLRLLHAVSQKWLHSHEIPDYFNLGYEVSAFDGSDSGDFWQLVCDQGWTPATTFRLLHIITGHYLNVNSKSVYDQEHAGGHPIYGSQSPDEAEWIVKGGVFADEKKH